MDLIGVSIRNRNMQCIFSFFAFLPSLPFVIVLYRHCQCIRHLIFSYNCTAFHTIVCAFNTYLLHWCNFMPYTFVLSIYLYPSRCLKSLSHLLLLLLFFCWLNSLDKWIFFFLLFSWISSNWRIFLCRINYTCILILKLASERK